MGYFNPLALDGTLRALGFTSAALLVVIAIMPISLSMLLSAPRRMKEKPRITHFLRNQRQICVGLKAYVDYITVGCLFKVGHSS